MAEHALSKEVIKNALLEIDPSVRKFHSNVLEAKTGITPSNAYSLNLEQSTHFFKQVWGNCLETAGQSLDKIGESIQEIEKFLKTFHSENEIHDFNYFLQKLGQYKGTNNLINSSDIENVVKTTELLKEFPSVGFKTATLIMRFLCLDSNFFKVERKTLIPPLDRVNYRMCQQIFGREKTEKLLGEIKDSFSKEKTMKFDEIGREVLNDDKVLIDNLWFIGHFYHDCSKKSGCEGTSDNCGCKIREGAKIINSQYLKNVDLPLACPLFKHGCNRTKCTLPVERKKKTKKPNIEKIIQ